MKAIAIHEFGGVEVLRYGEVPTPEPGEAEVLVRVKAAGVNPVDWKIRAGHLKDFLPHRFPIIPGWEMAGEVERQGFAARRFAPGDEVYAYCRRPVIQHGTYAQYIALPESYLALRPKSVSFEAAAAVPLAGLTAYQCLHGAAKLQAGESCVIVGASGGVGSLAVQLARVAQARVVGVASRRNHEYLQQLGASQVVDYTAGDFSRAVKALLPEGADVVYDCVGGEALAQAYECVRPGGRVVSILARDTDLAARKRAQHLYVFVEPNALQLDHLASLLDADQLRVHLSQVYPLTEAARAQEAIASGHTRGKLVIRVE
ncbi:MAG: NADP-dependent oxidoreductase [Candidatus Methylomirabilales bacterium]